jgi:hypothetical protein
VLPPLPAPPRRRSFRPARRGRAAAAGLAAVGLAALTLTGCAKFNEALSQRWVDVSFRAGTTVAQVKQIRAACSHVPNVTVQQIRRNQPAIDITAGLRFNTTNASDANVAQLQMCVSKFPAAVGFNPQDASDSGG